MAKELTTQSYIEHHLTNLTCGQLKDGWWSCDPHDVENMTFWAFPCRLFILVYFLGRLFLLLFKRAMPKHAR